MKILHYINCFFYLITVIPYATFYLIILGLYAQILLGFTQLIIAVLLLLSINKMTKKIKIMIKSYWIITIIIITILLGNKYLNWKIINDYELLFMFIIPMLIATYFVYITYLIQKNETV